MKKKSCLILGILLVVFVAINVCLYMSGWYNEMVWGKSKSGFTTSYSPTDVDEMFDHTNRDIICIDDRWRALDGIKMRCQVSANIKKGKFDIVIYDITDVDYQSLQSTESLSIVYKKTIEKNGLHELDLSKLPEGKCYCLTVYCEEESDFYTEVTCDWDMERWMYLYDKYLTKLPFVEEKYNPIL